LDGPGSAAYHFVLRCARDTAYKVALIRASGRVGSKDPPRNRISVGQRRTEPAPIDTTSWSAAACRAPAEIASARAYAKSGQRRVDHGTICGRSCANSGHYKPLCACVDRTFVNSNLPGVRSNFFPPLRWGAQENIWQFMRQNWLSNRIFKSFDDIVDHCCYAWNTLIDQPWKIMSIARRDWAAVGHSI
jgi:hypothetical protein